MRRVSFFLWAACLFNAVSLYGQGHQRSIGSPQPLAITDGEKRVAVHSSKRRFGRGAKSHRALIEQYQEEWNKSPSALDAFVNGLNPKQKRSILRHAIKRHGQSAPITQRIEQDMSDADKARARKKTWRGRTSGYKKKARDHATRAREWGQSKYNSIRNRG